MTHIRTMVARRTRLGWGLAVWVVLAVLTSAPAPRAHAQRQASIQLVVDTAVRNSWDAAELRRLAEASPDPKWINTKRQEVATISIWSLIKEGSVSRDAISKVEIRSRNKLLASFEGPRIARLDPLVLRSGKVGRPWRLSSLDPGNPSPYGQPVVQRIEVTTTQTTTQTAK